MKKLFVNGTEIPEFAMQSAVEQMLNFYAMQGVPPDALKEHMEEIVASAQEQVIAALDKAIEAASADYQELTRLLEEKERAEDTLMALMQQWEDAQE